MRAHASIFSANKYFQIKVLNPYRVFVDRYERDSMHISTMLVFWSLFSLVRNSVVLAVYLLYSYH